MDIKETLAVRHNTHGNFEDGAAISQGICTVLRAGIGWENLFPAQREALEMIAHKMARIVTGNPDFADHWHDVSGYARLAEALCTDYDGDKDAK